MKPVATMSGASEALRRAAEYGRKYRSTPRPLHPTGTAETLRAAFCQPLPEGPTPGAEVIDALIGAAEPGLVGNTDPNFYAWVMGGSDEVGVAADWLTSIWGQNAAIFQTAPAAAVAEEAVAAWLLDLLDLPRDSSVGLVTGATMAGFVALAAARFEVLSRAGHDVEADGLQGAPFVHIFMSDDIHVSNEAALRHLGFGNRNFVHIPSDANGLMDAQSLAADMAQRDGPKIIIGQAGHINSGGFEDFTALADLAETHSAWLHIDGAFGLWARVLPEKAHLTRGLERADSWSVDGHKWLQIPYDSGFTIVRNAAAHRRAMSADAPYLNRSPDDGRNPNEFNPELSRRARGFAAWATLRALGKSGVREMIARHCHAARTLIGQIEDIPRLEVLGTGDLNQIALAFTDTAPENAALHLADTLNNDHGVFVKPTVWKGRAVVRLSFTSGATDRLCADQLARAIRKAVQTVLS